MTNYYQSTKCLFWSFLLSLPILFGNCQQQSQEEYLFRVSLLVNEQHTWYQAMDYFSQILEERSNGRMRAELYPSEQLGKELESIRMLLPPPSGLSFR